MTMLGGRRVNRSPCTEAEEMANWSIIADAVNNIIVNNENPGTPENTYPFVRFELNEAFGATLGTGLAGADVLGADGSDTGEDIVVYDVLGRYGGSVSGDQGYASMYGDTPVYEVIVIGDSAGAITDPDDVFNNVNDDGNWHYDDTTNTLYIDVTGSDDWKVLVSSADDTPQYLYDKFKDNGTRDANADPLIKVNIEDASGGTADENVRLWLDASAISGYSVNAVQNLVNNNGSTVWESFTSNVYIAILATDLAAATPSGLSFPATAAIHSPEGGGTTSVVGDRTIYNPYPYALPSSNAVYMAMKIYDDPVDSADDEYVVVGIDVLNLLMSFTGSGARTVFGFPEGASNPPEVTEFEWLETETCDGG